MTIELTPRGKLSEEQLRELEQKIGHPLPEDYRTWLAENDGADFPDWSVIPVRHSAPESPLWGFAGDPSTARLANEDDIAYSDWFTRDYLSIMDVTSGAIAIKLVGDDAGTIWWGGDSSEIPGDVDDPEIVSALYLDKVADSFPEFLDLWVVERLGNV